MHNHFALFCLPTLISSFFLFVIIFAFLRLTWKTFSIAQIANPLADQRFRLFCLYQRSAILVTTTNYRTFSHTHTHIHSPKTLGWNRFLSSSSVYYLHFRDQLNRSLADSCRFAHSDFVGRRKALILPILQVGEGGSLAMCVCVCARAINVFVLTSLHLCAKRSSAFCIFVVFDFCFQFCRSLLCSHFLLLVVVQLLSMR